MKSNQTEKGTKHSKTFDQKPRQRGLSYTVRGNPWTSMDNEAHVESVIALYVLSCFYSIENKYHRAKQDQ